MDHRRRIEAVVTALPDHDLDAFLVTDLTNVRYLTGFSGTNGQVLVTSSGAFLLTDPRYRERARSLVRDAEIVVYPRRLSEELATRVAAWGTRNVGYEAATMTVAQRDSLAGALEGVNLIGTEGLIENMRRVKDDDELRAIRDACRIVDEAFAWATGVLAPGITERDLALELEVNLRRAGAEGIAFPPIVGSGPLSAHIHHSPSARELDKGDVVLLDFGARSDGYCSDITRTVVLGPASDDQKERYELVLGAQLAAIRAVAPGIPGRDVDAAARERIVRAGHGDHFGHGLGHGVGLDVHEAPSLKDISTDTLAPGEVVTVEPGVYVPGSDGIRIEDCVVVTATGCEVLTSAPKDTLLEL
ncbi:MAG TPA: Xaa-Pro peptidase family protein [Actinomycetota bacterium]|nr:Xaa-Pro peptidase family protein [Actinomycetota bacterium]